MSKEDIEIIWQRINCEACYDKNINYCKEKCECKCREFKALKNILNQLQNLGERNFYLLNNGVPKEEFFKLQEKLKKEKNENKANKKRIEELEKEKEIHIKLEQQYKKEYLDAKKEVEKKDKIINEMAEVISAICTGITSIRELFEKSYCEFINSEEDCCWKTDKTCKDCIIQYFERKADEGI